MARRSRIHWYPVGAAVPVLAVACAAGRLTWKESAAAATLAVTVGAAAAGTGRASEAAGGTRDDERGDR